MATVSDFVVQRGRQWGVTRVFGFPGDGVGELDGALGQAERDGVGLSYVRPTHEEICALMAVAHAKFTGEVSTLKPDPNSSSSGGRTASVGNASTP